MHHFGTGDDWDQAVEWCEKGAALNHADSAAMLAMIVEDGIGGVKKDAAKAARLKAAQLWAVYRAHVTEESNLHSRVRAEPDELTRRPSSSLTRRRSTTGQSGRLKVRSDSTRQTASRR